MQELNPGLNFLKITYHSLPQNSQPNPEKQKELCEKIKAAYSHLLNEQVKKLVIVRPADKANFQREYALFLEKGTIEFRKKTTNNYSTSRLNLETGKIERDAMPTAESLNFFLEILRMALSDLETKKAILSYL